MSATTATTTPASDAEGLVVRQAGGIGLAPDLDGTEVSDTWVMAGTTFAFAVPDTASIVTITASAALRWRLNAAPAAASGNGTPAAGRALAAGARAAANIAPGVDRTLHLLTTPGTTVTVEALP